MFKYHCAASERRELVSKSRSPNCIFYPLDPFTFSEFHRGTPLLLYSLPQRWIMGKSYDVRQWVSLAEEALQDDSFHGVKSSHLTLLLDVMAVNEPCSLLYLLLRVIKAKALSLSIRMLCWFNFKRKRLGT